MNYNWQQPDWKNFSYSLTNMEENLFVFTEQAGQLKGLLKAMPVISQQETIIEILVSEAIKTSEIENEYLSREDVTSSIKNNLGFYKLEKPVKDVLARGVSKLMTEVRNTYSHPMTEESLKNWHRYLFTQKTHLTVGEWRSHNEPMQVISGTIGREIIHFEAPPSSDVPKNMKAFIQWFNKTAPEGQQPIKYAPVRAAIAHLYFETIHPFEDGNGRIGRAIADKALSQTLGFSLLLSLSEVIESNRKAYYDALKNAQKNNEITNWILYFLNVIIDAQQKAELVIEFTLKKATFFDLYKDKLNERQLKCINRMFKEGATGFEGGMTAKKYMRICRTSKATATRDLKKLEETNAFKVYGGGRNTHYKLNF